MVLHDELHQKRTNLSAAICGVAPTAVSSLQLTVNEKCTLKLNQPIQLGREIYGERIGTKGGLVECETRRLILAPK